MRKFCMTQAMQKSELRKLALERRASVPDGAREAFAGRLAVEGVALARQAQARSVSAYWPMRGEADVGYLLHALDYHEFRPLLPCVEGRGKPLLFRLWSGREAMVPADFGTMEPSRRQPEGLPDVLFVPLACFDRRGHRVGYGAGYYDLTLAHLRSIKPVLAVGVAFATQEVHRVPDEPHDARLDFVLTETELIDCRSD